MVGFRTPFSCLKVSDLSTVRNLSGQRRAARTAVPSARIAPCSLNRAAVSRPRHPLAAHTRVPIWKWTCRCGSPARLVLWTTATVCSRSTGTTSCRPRGPTRVTECNPRNRRISATASARAASSASDTSGCSAAAIDSDFGVLTTISANRGDPRFREPSSPGSRGLPIELPVNGSIQSTQEAYDWESSSEVASTSPLPFVTVNAASVVPPSR